MNTSNLVLHPEAKARIGSFLAQPSHALLVVGAVGVGKTHLAREIAQSLLQLTSSELDRTAYYREVRPTKGVITIEQVRELIKFFKLKVPDKAAVERVVVLQDADTMGTEAQNALLKLLEEPPEGSILLLTSSRPLGLLPTIRSRAQQITLPEPSRAALQAYFESSGHDNAQVQKSILRHGANIAAIQESLTGESGTTDTSLELVKQVLSGNAYARMLQVDGLAKKEMATAFTDTLATVAMASLQAAAEKGSSSLARWQAILQATHTAQEALDRNGNTKLVLTELMLSL